MNEVKQVLCDEPVRQRGVDRFRIDTVGAIHSRGSVDHEVSIINISTAGCLIRSDRILPIGSRQTLTIRGIGFVEGRVVWQLGQRAGFEFAQELQMRSLFDAMLEASKNDLPPAVS
jgi:hypothetical protein